jgi:hypothetical protein
MKLSERQLAVEIQHNQQMFGRPHHTGGFRHGIIMAELVWPVKKEI